MAHHNITTVASLRCALKTAKAIYVQARFGNSEAWIKITKGEANVLVGALHDTCTPESLEMYSGIFGTMTNGGTLYLG